MLWWWIEMEIEVATWKINKGTEVIEQEDYKNLVPEQKEGMKIMTLGGQCECEREWQVRLLT